MSITDLNEALDKAERGILNFFLPRRCPFCGAVTGKDLLCDKCEKSLPYTGERAVEEAGFARCAAPLYYDGSVRKAILDFKFGRKMGAVSCFGQMMAQCAAENFSGEFDAVTWVPVSKNGLKSGALTRPAIWLRPCAWTGTRSPWRPCARWWTTPPSRA